MEKVLSCLNKVLESAFESCGYDKVYGAVALSNRPDLCQYQCNGALPLAKKIKKSPQLVAEEIASKLVGEPMIASISIAGPGFINMNVSDEFIVNYLNNMYADSKLGVPKPQNPMSIIVDYGGANVAKPLHVGHLRAAIIGESIKRIARFSGHTVIGDVHLGDWGLQIGMVISELNRRKPELPYFDMNYTNDYPQEAPFTIDELEEIYPFASKLAKEDNNAMEEARRATFELQNNRPGYIALWKHILNVSISDLKQNYGQLNVEFDLWKGESDCQKSINEMIQFIKGTGYAYESQGALVMDVEEPNDTYEIPPIILIKSDGATLYSTTDLATIWERVKEYNPDEIIYVVDKRQGLHFEQVFRCAKKTNIIKQSAKLTHIGFGTMNGKDGKPFKTRDGSVMRLENLIDTIKSNVRNKMKENDSFDSKEVEDITHKVGISALKYGDLSNQATKNYVLDIDQFTSFEGNTGPYILYTTVRIKSILNKAEQSKLELNMIQLPNSEIERNLMLKLVRFNEIVENSFLDKAPHKICDYLYELSNLFNKFYHENHILAETDSTKQGSWLKLLTLSKLVLEKSLYLLAIETPDRM